MTEGAIDWPVRHRSRDPVGRPDGRPDGRLDGSPGTWHTFLFWVAVAISATLIYPQRYNPFLESRRPVTKLWSRISHQNATGRRATIAAPADMHILRGPWRCTSAGHLVDDYLFGHVPMASLVKLIWLTSLKVRSGWQIKRRVVYPLIWIPLNNNNNNSSRGRSHVSRK